MWTTSCSRISFIFIFIFFSEAQDKLALYRQQLAAVTAKKTSLLQPKDQLTQSLESKKQEMEEKKAALASLIPSTAQGIPLNGEALKQYVADLRVKSQHYKQAKESVHGMQRETQVLQRTVEILMQQKEQLQRSLSEQEQKQGVSGYTDQKQTLVNLSEPKGTLEDTNEEAMHEYTALMKALTDAIRSHQHHLARAIQELKALRAKTTELETKYIAAKKDYDAQIVTSETSVVELQKGTQECSETMATETSLWHTHMASMLILDTTMDQVLREMKQYTEDTAREFIQRECGFLTWWDFIQRKCLEAEALAKQTQAQHKRVEELQAPNEKSLGLFRVVHRILQKCLEMNQKYINKPKEPKDVQEILSPTEQRLVIS